MCDSSANRRWACSNLAVLSFKELGTKRCATRVMYRTDSCRFSWTFVWGTYQHAHGITHITSFFLQCTRGSTCGWPRVHTFSGGAHCIDHCCGSFGHGSVRIMRPALSVAFLVCGMSAAVIRTPYVAFRSMSGSVASE